MSIFSIKNISLLIFLFVVPVLLTGCSSESAIPENNSYNSSSFDNTSSNNAEPLTFHGYECTDDCSGHEAGYDWAEENSITDSSDCGGNSNSFIEGCEAYADENGY